HPVVSPGTGAAMRCLSPLLVLLVPSAVSAQPPKGELPRVLLLGDSIRLGYAPLVAKKLAGKAEVISPAENGGDTANTLRLLDKWLADGRPLVVHVNCGLHDLKFGKKTQAHQVPPDRYEANLKAIVERLRKATPHVVFATTTPILDDRHAGRKADFDRFDKDVKAYNERAVRVMLELGVPVDDLYRIV